MSMIKSNAFVVVLTKLVCKEHCEVKKTKYGTVARCQCIRHKRECTDQCKCRNCKNPFGSRPYTNTPVPVPKTRISGKRHCWQKEMTKSAIFAANLQHSVSSGPRTQLEYLIIAGILQFCLLNGLDTVVADFYSTFVDYAKAVCPSLPIGHKSMEDLEKVCSEYHHNLEAYETISCPTEIKCIEVI